ncbi:MAG: cysteine rich repeat-containing protein [Phreatobacter sp.]
MPHRLSIAIGALGLALALPVTAAGANENLSFAQRLAIYRACKADLDRNCPSAGTDAGRIRACLTTHQRSLSQTCLATLQASGAR